MTSQDYEAAANEAVSEVAHFEDERKGLLGHFQHALHVTPALVPLIVLLVGISVFGLLLGERFFSASTLTLILQQVQIVGILAAAQTLIILTAGIDLSVGAIAVFCSVIMGQATFRYFIPGAEGLFGCLIGASERDLAAAIEAGTASGLCSPFLGSALSTIAIGIGLAIGTAIGAISGFLVSRVKLPPFIVTLGMWQIVLAANYLYSANETIRGRDIAEAAPPLQFLGTTFSIGGANFTYGVVLMILLVGILAYCLRSTAWGRHVYAVGDDPEAAELAGVNVKRTLMSVYMLSGFICALAAWAMIGRFSSVSPSASTGVVGNIQAITAVVIGGISLFGGRGSIMGAFFGALIVGTFELGLRMAGADPQWTFMLIGMLIIAAVAVDQWIRKVSA
ncbi:MAG: ABC transporter permease [Pseudomonadota bacterium]